MTEPFPREPVPGFSRRPDDAPSVHGQVGEEGETGPSGGTVGVLRNRPFLLLWLSQAATQIGGNMVVYGLTQHAGLAENVLDHRLNCRTVYMNPVHRYLYWNMNYHVEHHMFPMVPYHALGTLHQELKADMPTPYRGLWEAYREIIPTVIRQLKDPTYFARRVLPETARPYKPAPEPAL